MKKNQFFALCALVILVLTACENPFIPQKYKEPPPPQSPSISVEVTPIGPYVKGEGVTITAKASVSDGGELSYQWYSNTKNSSSGGTAVSGATGETYMPSTDMSSENILEPSISYYYVQVTNTLNGKTTAATSRIIDVTVFDIPIGTTPIREVGLNVTAPVKDGVPATTVTSTGSGYTIQSVSWNPPHNTFMSGGKYTIWVNLQADAGYTFIALKTATMNGQAAAVENNNGTTLYLSYEFPSVDLRVVTGISVKVQPNEITYTHGDTLMLQGLTVTLSYDSGEPEDILFANFASRVITASPAHGITLSHTSHHNTPVTVSCNGYTADTAPLTVNKVDIATVMVSITAPAKDGVPNLTAATEGEAGYTVSAVSWRSSSVAGVPGDPFTGHAFLSNTYYTATVTVTARPDYEFANGMTAHINNASATITNNPDGTKTISLQFEKTYEGDVVSITVITQPTKTSYVHGETLNLAGLQVQVNFESGTPAVIVFGGSNLLSTLPPQGEILRHSAHDGLPIQVNYSGKTANTNNLTVSKKQLTLNTSSAEHTKVYDGTTAADNIARIELSGTVSGDQIYIDYGQAVGSAVNGVYQSADAGTKIVNITYVRLAGSQFVNYELALPVNNVTLTAIGTGNVGITPATPTVTWPTASTTNPGWALSTSTLSGGSARGVNNANVPGNFAWTNSGNVSSSGGVFYYPVTFTPTSGNYSAVTGNVSVIVSTVELIRVNGGTFQMGQNGDQTIATNVSGNVTPLHNVTLSAFYMSKYQVTQELYNTVMTGNTDFLNVSPSSFSSSPASGEVQNRRPVEQVTWYDAVYFCNRLSTREGLTPVYTITITSRGGSGNNRYITGATVTADWTKNGYRLPTEAEWEYAAKGGTSAHNPPYIWAGVNVETSLANYAWYSVNADSKTYEVGKKQPNELGIYDMAGNVWEWCWDWSGAYESNAQINPRGASSGTNRIYRGGAWSSAASSARSVYRFLSNPNDRRYYIGFRLVRP
jgi:formylglycine-generating enzyme required for sulfatase activity